jgi:hypothetical protein
MIFKAQVSRFQSFKVSMVTERAGFKVSEFQGFNDSGSLREPVIKCGAGALARENSSV